MSTKTPEQIAAEAELVEQAHKLTAEILSKGMLSKGRAIGSLAHVLQAAADDDGKCGCRDVCGCHSKCGSGCS